MDDSIATYLDAHPDASAPYEFALIKNVGVEGATAQEVSVILMDPEPVIAAILADQSAGVPANLIAKKFHDAVINLIVLVARLAISALTVDTVVLSGGVFMNRYLTEGVIEALTAARDCRCPQCRAPSKRRQHFLWSSRARIATKIATKIAAGSATGSATGFAGKLTT